MYRCVAVALVVLATSLSANSSAYALEVSRYECSDRPSDGCTNCKKWDFTDPKLSIKVGKDFVLISEVDRLAYPSPHVLEGCKVVDEKNWFCESKALGVTQRHDWFMRNGTLTVTYRQFNSNTKQFEEKGYMCAR